MNSPRITLLESQDRRLRNYLQAHPEGHERAAVVLFRRLHREIDGLPPSDRYIALEVYPFEEAWITGSSSSHIAFELKHLRELFRRCDEESLVFGFVHNHPTGFPDFSDVDEGNERTLLQALGNRNGPAIHFVALLWAKDAWRARVRNGQSPHHAEPARHVLTTSRPLKMFGQDSQLNGDEDMSERQAAAFGRPFVKQLQSLRVGVVGAGGTGSPIITLLARAGVGELLVVDGDKLEKSNLNRLRGASMADVGRNKAHILQDFIRALALPIKIVGLDTLVDTDGAAIDALSTCDFIFGCTDDQIGREVLNTAAYVYAQPYIDVGLGGQVSTDGDGRPYLRYHYGRVSTILPEEGECLFCQGVIRDDWIRHQYALRENPDLAPAEARDRYLEGGGEQAPGVGPFTSAVADYGVATLFDLLRPFRRFPDELRWDAFSIDFIKMSHRSKQEQNDTDCPYCYKREYLLLKEEYRLNRPMLGKPDAAR
jgi:molybdopterin-synthase adenylyltransferase